MDTCRCYGNWKETKKDNANKKKKRENGEAPLEISLWGLLLCEKIKQKKTQKKKKNKL